MNPTGPESAAPAAQDAPDAVCARLRSKKYYMLGRPALTAADILDGSQHCWCQRTKLAIGPDAGVVDPIECCPGRSCYEPLGVLPS
ncbi:MAG: hypothetical protein EPO68_12150 [Planctomycetota bacterium]|nr:MAG: hypothetical protein EPO68_12150 [Planctomycetota bacterium]